MRTVIRATKGPSSADSQGRRLTLAEYGNAAH
jgi:hypothetical protein